ncbi:hypothetical protein VM1G_09855 [Cytospora mali]|uniref:Uncharacterized protein n=1 Tax=Cytospora mali TaxID=578113 RepID=A0A194WDX4_CYTMA|nr:hypothetical protein VM1G_09855 [Valsa mali]
MKHTTLLTLAIGSLAAATAVESYVNMVERSCVTDCITEDRPPMLCASLCSKRTVDVDVEVQKRVGAPFRSIITRFHQLPKHSNQSSH